MACGDTMRRKIILDKLRNLVDSMDEFVIKPCCDPCGGCDPCGSCGPCCPPPYPPCPPPPNPCCPPMIEMYDPCPKPAIPLACPGPIAPLDPDIPVPHVASPTNPCGGVCIPIVAPQPVPCIPLAADCGSQMQPCVPCNPPQMMVCYRRGGCGPRRGGARRSGGGGGGGGGGGRGGGGGVHGCKSCELRASIFYRGCDCERRNGLQDACPRTGCQGNRKCTTDPASCCPSQFSCGKHLPDDRWTTAGVMGSGGYSGGGYSGGGGGCCSGGGCSSGGGGGGGGMRAEYLCFPAYFKMPPCSPDTAPPMSPFGGPMPCNALPTPNAGPCPSCDDCCPMPQCCPPVPTIPMPPCPPVAVPGPPQIIPTPIPLPVPTAVYPLMPNTPPCCPYGGNGCPPPLPSGCCGLPCGPMC